MLIQPILEFFEVAFRPREFAQSVDYLRRQWSPAWPAAPRVTMVALTWVSRHRFINDALVDAVEAFRPRIWRPTRDYERIGLSNCLIQDPFCNLVCDGLGAFADQATILLHEIGAILRPAVLPPMFAALVSIWHVPAQVQTLTLIRIDPPVLIFSDPWMVS
jgi:hypothetical protein